MTTNLDTKSNSVDKCLIVLVGISIFTVALLLFSVIGVSSLVYGQTNNISNTANDANVAQTIAERTPIASDSQVSTGDAITTLLGSGGLATGIFAGVKTLLTNRDQKRENRLYDHDWEHYMKLRKLEDNYTLKYPDKPRSEILKMPAFPDEPALTTTLAQAFAQFHQSWFDYNDRKYYQNKNP